MDNSKVYNKLVRDNILEILKSKGLSYSSRIADDNEYLEKLNKKLLEEVREYLEENSKEEIADILEVIRSIIKANGWEESEIEDIQAKKHNERGGFDRKIILEEVE